MRTNDFFGALAFPGSGKTAIALDSMYQYRETSLVIVPLEILYTTWMNEYKKWDFSKNLTISLLHGPDKDANFRKKAAVYLINPEGLKWLLTKIKATKVFPWRNLYVDESVKFKAPKSVRFKTLCKMLKSFKRRYILCGNPMPNHYLDLWSQLFILDLGERLGTSWYQFRNTYFYPTDYKRFNWILKPGAEEAIVAKISDIVYFLEADDENLPERIEINTPVYLPDMAQRKYKVMQDQLFYQIDQEENVLAANKTASLMKCWQMANGFIYKTDDETQVRTTHFIHNEGIVQTKEIVESLQGSPVLIAYHFKEDLVRLHAAFPDARIVGSGMKPQDIKAAEEDWNKDRIPILLAYVSKFSHGLNLQLGSGHNIIFFCLTYNFDIYDQLIRRFQRQGASFKKVVVHRIVAQNTVHQAIINNIETKKTNSESFLSSLVKYRISQLK